MPERTYKESFKVAADQLVDAIKRLLQATCVESSSNRTVARSSSFR